MSLQIVNYEYDIAFLPTGWDPEEDREALEVLAWLGFQPAERAGLWVVGTDLRGYVLRYSCDACSSEIGPHAHYGYVVYSDPAEACPEAAIHRSLDGARVGLLRHLIDRCERDGRP